MRKISKTPPSPLDGLIRSDPRMNRPRKRSGSMFTNRTGNARSGQDYDTTYQGDGDSVHTYADGRRVVVHHDSPADAIGRTLMSTKKSSSKSTKNSAASKRRRQRDRSNATTYNPSAVLGGDDLRRMVNDMVDLQTRPLLDDLDRERAQTEAQSQRVTGNTRNYYNDLLNRQQQLVANAQQIDASANAAQTAAAGQANAAQDALTAAGQKAISEDADVRGDVAHIADKNVASDAAAREQSVANQRSADSGLIASQGATGAQFANEMAGVSGMRGGEALKELTDRYAQQLGDIGSKRREVVEKRGDLRTDILSKLRQQQYDNLVTARGLGLKEDELSLDQDKLGETNRHNTEMEKAAMTANQIRSMHNDRTYGLDKAKFGASQAKDRYQRKHKLGPYRPGGSKASDGGGRGLGSLSPSQEQGKLDSIDSIRSLVADGRKHFHDDWGKISRALQSGQNPEQRAYPALYIKVAIELERDGAISRDTATALQRRGIHVGGNFPISGGAQDYNGGN